MNVGSTGSTPTFSKTPAAAPAAKSTYVPDRSVDFRSTNVAYAPSSFAFMSSGERADYARLQGHNGPVRNPYGSNTK